MIQIKVDDKRLKGLQTMLQRLPEDFDRDQVMMTVFRKASQPMLSAGRAESSISVPNLARHSDFKFSSRKSKKGDVMRVGLINRGHGKLGHIFNEGTEDRFTNDGGYRGAIDSYGFWDRAVASSEPKVISRIDKFVPIEIDKYVKKYNI